MLPMSRGGGKAKGEKRNNKDLIRHPRRTNPPDVIFMSARFGNEQSSKLHNQTQITFLPGRALYPPLLSLGLRKHASSWCFRLLPPHVGGGYLTLHCF